jgi:hypothetical protein
MKDPFRGASNGGEAGRDARAKQLETLDKWIRLATQDLTDNVAYHRGYMGQNPYDHMKVSVLGGIPAIDGLDRNDLEVLKPALRELYDVAKKLDVAIELEGFDLLPRVAALAGTGSIVTNGSVYAVVADLRRGFNYAYNPYSDQELADYRSGHGLTPDGPK